MTTLCWILLSSSLAAGCLPVTGDRIEPRDLATVIPEFAPAVSALGRSPAFGWAPAPGVERVIESAEVLRWAQRHGIELAAPPPRVCVTRAVSPLLPQVLEEAVGRAGRGWEIALRDWPRGPFPAGELRFDPRALPRPPRQAGEPPLLLWRGALVTASGQRYPVWAKVNVSIRRRVVVLAEQAKTGMALRADQAIVTEADEHPLWTAPLSDLAALDGQRARRTLRAGQVVLASDLTPLPAVRRGDRVAVLAGDAGAQVQLDAQAEADAHTGQTVLLKNPLNGRRFIARVVGPGRAVPAPASSRQHPEIATPK